MVFTQGAQTLTEKNPQTNTNLPQETSQVRGVTESLPEEVTLELRDK